MHVAIVADRRLIVSTRQIRARLDIGVDENSRDFGASTIAPRDSYCGPAGGQVVTWVNKVDVIRYVDDYVAALQSPDLRPMPPEYAEGIYPRK
jgi:hypothetical protein